MKAILMSIKPQHVANILNELKTLEIRKRFPKDYVGWVYIYCTKDRKQCLVRNNINKTYHLDTCYWDEFESNLNGKVVARFWCDKVDNYANGSKIAFENGTYIFGTNADFETILKPSCLTEDELYDYCEDLCFCAIHITKLEIFDYPKEIYEMKRLEHFGIRNKCEMLVPITRAPQSYCFIEI